MPLASRRSDSDVRRNARRTEREEKEKEERRERERERERGGGEEGKREKQDGEESSEMETSVPSTRMRVCVSYESTQYVNSH